MTISVLAQMPSPSLIILRSTRPNSFIDVQKVTKIPYLYFKILSIKDE
jgi:hypothetical protein